MDGMYWESRCKVCVSPHRAEYIRLRLEEHKTYKQLEEIAASKYKEAISDASFQRCFTRHMYPSLKWGKTELMKSEKKTYSRTTLNSSRFVTIKTQLFEDLAKCYVSTWDRYLRLAIDRLHNVMKADEKEGIEQPVKDISICFEALEELTSEVKIEKQEMSIEEYDYCLDVLNRLPSDIAKAMVERFKWFYERVTSTPPGEDSICPVCRSSYRVFYEHLWQKGLIKATED